MPAFVASILLIRH